MNKRIKELFWKKTHRKGEGWVDLMVKTESKKTLPTPYPHPLLDAQMGEITHEVLAQVLSDLAFKEGFEFFQVDKFTWANQLHEELRERKIRPATGMRKKHFIALHVSMDGNDPGQDTIEMEMVPATTESQALKEFYRDNSEDFEFVTIWDLDRLITYLQSLRETPIKEVEKVRKEVRKNVGR